MTDKLHLENLPLLTISEIVESLSKSFISFIKNGIKFKEFPSVMLWGPPGVGKSQSVREIADEIKKNTGKKVNITDVRLLLFNPIDLRGIPTASEDKTLAVWLKPKIFQMDESEEVVNILFLDEISSCTPAVQAAAYQITLDRVIGEHKLPDNCIVIAAGNRLSDKSVVSKMPKALANRLMHIEVEIDVESWLTWAKNNRINDIVIKFIDNNRKYLMRFANGTDDLAYATPRTWEMVSNLINNIKDDTINIEPLISGLIGKDLGLQFSMHFLIKGNIPSIRDIFNGRLVYNELNEETLEVLKNAIVNYANEHKEDIQLIKNSLRYIVDMPMEYAVYILKLYLKISEKIRIEIEAMPEFKSWYDKVKIANAK